MQVKKKGCPAAPAGQRAHEGVRVGGYRILKPDGILLLTSHGISKIGRQLGRDGWGEYWRITTQSAVKLFDETFPDADVTVGSYGNVLTAMCALHGIASDEIDKKELDYLDPDFEVIVTVRAVKLAYSNDADR